MGQLEGQVAVVTGAGRGFGRAIAERLAGEGAKVAVLSRSPGELEAVVAAITSSGGITGTGGTATAIACDVTDPASIKAAVAEAEARLGPVSILVNNAGIPGPFGPIWEVDPDEWWRAQAIHIRAPMLFLQAVLPGMIARKAGRVVCVSAIASRMVAANLSAYCTGKIAQNRIVAEAAVELAGTGVSVFAIDPGFVFTQLARDTMEDAAAQKYLSGMVERLREASTKGQDDDLARCAQRVLDLVSGRYDALSGGYFELPDDLDAKLEEKAG